MLTQTFTYRCDASACTNAAVHQQSLCHGMVPTKPSHPVGWWATGGMYFCPRHRVRLTVDDAVVAEQEAL